MPTIKQQFNVYVYPSDIKRFKRTTRKLGVSQAYLFKKALDMIESGETGHNTSRNRPAKASQTAQIAPDRVSKRRVVVREGGSK